MPNAVTLPSTLHSNRFLRLIGRLVFCLPGIWLTSAFAASDTPQFYRSPEERREAENGLELADGLNLSALFELERAVTIDQFADDQSKKSTPAEVPTLELSVDMEFTDWLSAEMLFEATKDPEMRSHLEEAFITIEASTLEISIGRQVVPFGEYYSHFVSGPMVEFGETRGTTLLFEYTHSHWMESHVYLFEGDHAENRYDTDQDWGIGLLLFNRDESLRVGINYLSDLSESEDRLLEEVADAYIRRVAGVDTHFLVAYAPLELTLEYLQALDNFVELEADQDQPRALNTELAWYVNAEVQLVWRIEHSHELEDEPKRKYGISLAWLPLPHTKIAFDCLRGIYRRELVEEGETWLDRRLEYVAQLTLEW